MARDSRIGKALSAMWDLGIRAETVKPVLKNLLRLYDNNWELIEAENYRALADAIFEHDESKLVEGKRKGDMRNDGSESPCKRLHSGEQDDQGSSSVGSGTLLTPKYELVEGKRKSVMSQDGSKPPAKRLHSGEHDDQVSSTMDNSRPMLALEEDEIPSITSRQYVMDSFQSCPSPRDRGIESSFLQPHKQFNNKGKDPISSHVASTDKTLNPGRASHVMHVKEPGDKTCSVPMRKQTMATNKDKDNFIKPKTERLSNDVPHYAVSSSMVHSGTLVAPYPGNNCTVSSTSQHINSDKKDNGSTSNCCTSCKGTFNIASSLLGEVKISVNCNSVLGQPNFRIPILDTVLKFVEKKYLRSYKIVGPEFSVTKLLKDLCTSYLEMGTDSTNRYVIAKSSPSISAMGPNKGNFRINGPAKGTGKDKSSCSGSSKSNILANFQQEDRERSVSRIRDITNGLETMEISLVDETGKELVPKFVYIPQNIVYQKAYVHITLARIADEDCCSSCLGNCLSSSIPCACARETGGEYAYTPQGLLKEEFLRACISMNREPQNHHFFYCQPSERCKNENVPGPCKGHLVRKFIKECWRKCGCHLRCGNRVVQRGITCKLQVFLTHGGKGWGLRALEDIPKGAFVCEYVGEILTNTELYERNEQSSGNERHTYPVLLDADWGSEGILNDEEALCLDATFYGNVARFINHRCFDSNLLEIPVEVETPDHHYYHIAFFTQREVHAMEELTWDYGIDFSDDNHPIKAFRCCCGSAVCRDRGTN